MAERSHAMLAVTILPDKPNQVVPSALLAPAGLEEAEATLRTLTPASSSGTQRPAPERFALPPTANSEYGFFSHNNVSRLEHISQR